MRITARGLDDVFTYPCTKGDVKEVFGNDLLRSLDFGPRADYIFNARRGRPAGIEGVVLLYASVSRNPIMPGASISVYRVRKDDWSDYLRWQVRVILEQQIRPWIDAMLSRPDTSPGGYKQCLLTLHEGRLVCYPLSEDL